MGGGLSLLIHSVCALNDVEEDSDKKYGHSLMDQSGSYLDCGID